MGLDAGFGGGGSYNQFYQVIGVTEGLALVPSLTVEPRWYYNFQERHLKNINTDKNSGNFIALRIKYFPDWFTIAQNNAQLFTTQQISFIPKWGLKRTYKDHFTLEAGAGVGYFYNIDIENNRLNEFDDSGVMIDLHLRIGYTF